MWCRGWWPCVREAYRQDDAWTRGLQALLWPLRTLGAWLGGWRAEPGTEPHALSGVLVRWHRRLRGPAREQLRGLVAAGLCDPAWSAFDAALATASTIAIPEARETLLTLLCDARLTGEPARSQLIRALGRLRDPSLRHVYVRLLRKYAPAVAAHRQLLATVYQAAWALCLCSPGDLSQEAPCWLGTDPLFLSDVLEHGDRAVAAAAADLLTHLEPVKRRFVLRNLTARARVRLGELR